MLVSGRSIGQRIGAGRARIIACVEDMPLQAGEVLVADMTDPDWEPIMKRCDAEPVRASLESLLNQRMGKPWAWGLLVHALGDSYAHAYAKGPDGSEELFSWPFGHGFSGHEPDIIANYKAKYRRFLEALYRALQQPDRAPRRCLLDRLKEFVDCPQWDTATDEVGALNCYSSHQRLPKRPLPALDLTLSPDAIDDWIEMVKLAEPGAGE